MTVDQLIKKLLALPGDLPVHINDEARGVLHTVIDAVFEIPEDPEYSDENAVVIAVNAL
jgi:hypothetical protein